jgi:serine/threonine-protein kinase
MGEVWVAYDQRIGRNVAVKTLHRQGQSQGEVDRFLREAQTAGRLNHPNIVTVHDVGQDQDGTLYLVMELLGGSDLSAVLRVGPPPVPSVVGWAVQIAAGLTAAHAAGIAHHDLKPANVQLTETGLVKILDFGIARYVSATTKASSVVGTVAYMAPERLQGNAGDGRSDLYALGCMLYELITGVPPFRGDSPAAVMLAHISQPPNPAPLQRADVPKQLQQLVLALLAKDPKARPATAQLLQAQLIDIGARAAAQAAPTDPAPTLVYQDPRPSATRRLSRKAIAAAAGAAVVVAGGVVTAVALSSNGHADQITTAQLASYCDQFYEVPADGVTSAECEQIAQCYQPKLSGITLTRFTVVAAYNSDSNKPEPPQADADLVDNARKACDSESRLSSLQGYVDGVAGDT